MFLRTQKVFLFAALTATLLASPVSAHDKVDRSKLTREQTFKQLAKDLAGLEQTAKKAAKALADEKILCLDSSAADMESELKRLATKVEKAEDDGYVFHGLMEKQVKQSYVGTGLRLRYMDEVDTTVVTIDGLPGSPAARTEFFDRPYIVLEVDGTNVFLSDIDTIQKMIRGDGKPNTGVTLTLQREEGGREYTRFLSRKRIMLTQKVMCGIYRK